MYLIDTSAWVEYFRATGSPTHLEVRRLLREQPADVHLTEPVIMEVLADPNTARTLDQIEKLVAGLPLLEVDTLADYRAAAGASRASRQNGHPVRSLDDCLIAAVATRTGAAVVHRDRDYEHLADVLPDLWLHR